MIYDILGPHLDDVQCERAIWYSGSGPYRVNSLPNSPERSLRGQKNLNVFLFCLGCFWALSSLAWLTCNCEMFHESDPWYHCVAVSLPSTGGLSRIVWPLQTPHTGSPDRGVVTHGSDGQMVFSNGLLPRPPRPVQPSSGPRTDPTVAFWRRSACRRAHSLLAAGDKSRVEIVQIPDGLSIHSSNGCRSSLIKDVQKLSKLGLKIDVFR